MAFRSCRYFVVCICFFFLFVSFDYFVAIYSIVLLLCCSVLFLGFRFVPFSLPKGMFFFLFLNVDLSLSLILFSNWYFSVVNNHISYSMLCACLHTRCWSNTIRNYISIGGNDQHTEPYIDDFWIWNEKKKERTKKKSQSSNDARRK